jgi:cytoskeleton protein RodZ
MTDTQPAAAGPTAGSLLREARERQGIHIGALAAAIKVTPRKLDSLENDRWDELPDATFARALAQTVCRTLKIDAAPVLALLPTSAQVALEPVSNANHQPFRDRPGRADPGFAGQAIRPMLWSACALMLAAVAVYFLPPDLLSPVNSMAQAPAREPAVLPPLPVPEPTAAPATGVEASVGQAPDPAAPPVAMAGPGVPVAGATPVAVGGLPAASLPLDAQPLPGAAAPAAALPAAATAAAPTPTVSAPAAAAPATPPGSRPLQLSSSAPSWVEVRDAAGELLLSRTLLPGETVGVDGSLPLRLTIGNAAATSVAFRGQPVDLAARTRENVARFEVQ